MVPKQTHTHTHHHLLTWSALNWVDPSWYIRVTTRATACWSISINCLFSKSSKYLVSQKWFLNALEFPGFRDTSTSSASPSNATCLLVFSNELLHVTCFLFKFMLSLVSLFKCFSRKCFLLHSVFCRTEASWLHCGIRHLEGATKLMLFCFGPADS